MKTRSLIIILIIATLVVIIISWFIFDWPPTIGSIILLLVVAGVGVVSFGNILVSLIKNWTSLGGSSSKARHRSRNIFRQIPEFIKTKAYTPPQRREWPSLRKDDHHQPLGRLLGKRSLLDPFRSEHAEEDEPLLFLHEKPLFWWDLPQIQQLSENNSVFSYISGESGSGKSALAMALGSYAPSPFSLGIFRQGLPAINDIYLALANKLLTFLHFHPTYLGYLGAHERVLLIDVLMKYFNSYILQAEIERMSDTKNWDWLSQAADEKLKKDWQALGVQQLRKLQQSLTEHAEASVLSEQEWPIAFNHVCKSLRFKKIIITIDANHQTDPTWILRLREQVENNWSLAGLQAFIFLPEDVIGQWKSNGVDLEKVAPVERLCWIDAGKNYLRDMVDYRWSTINPQITMDAFTGGRINELVDQANGNPSAFVRHWQAYVAAKRRDGKG